MMELIDGKKVAQQIKDELKEEVKSILKNGGKVPHLAAVLVGDDGASLTYVNAKVIACEAVGFKSTLVKLPASTSEKELLKKIDELNRNNDIDGFIVQVPLPDHIDSDKIIMAIDPSKDVDGFHPMNIGKMVLGLPGFLPATPFGIVQLLERYKIETAGKHCVVVGRSNIVGSPISILMSRNREFGNSTVTITHSRTKNLKEICLQADILILAIGKAEFVTGDMIKKDAVVIDVGIHRINDTTKKSGYRLKGDANFDEVASKASRITPVPGGVGPMTIASLLKNTMIASKKEF